MACQKLTFRNERYARKGIYHWGEGQASASLVMPDNNPQDRFFCLPLTPMINSYNLHYSEVRGYAV